MANLSQKQVTPKALTRWCLQSAAPIGSCLILSSVSFLFLWNLWCNWDHRADKVCVWMWGQLEEGPRSWYTLKGGRPDQCLIMLLWRLGFAMRAFVGKWFTCAAILYAVHRSLRGFAILLGAQTCRIASPSVKYGSGVLNKCARNVRMGMT